MDLSVMFFGAETDPAESAAAKYRDIVTIAQEADRLGFRAVWTPERHFQRFGGAFPAPAVLGAALAALTERIEVRAGSAVLPLKHPLRTVEEWSVLDNLSGGRVGLSVATGWHSTDFVLAPHNFADRRENALEQVELIRRLWAGDGAEFLDGLGEPVEVRPGPRPYSRTLPLWLTSSGSPRTWEAAGRLRTNVLAAAPGQSREELAAKIELYRKAFDEAPPQLGAPSRGTVTLMVHAYVGDDEAGVRGKVREPLKSYFKSYFQQIASSKVGAGETAAPQMTDAQQDMMAEFAFERYLTFGSLLGTPERCRAALGELRDLGCDEVACLVDFGLGLDDVLTSLHRLRDAHAGLEPADGESL
ncbi:MAG TPA: MupA/Atu3671 family FMN-dependent luciferase-like monooxygenase [Actinospica sp.]|jgi:natural product biosynthesis luciferase-like monooxygenase protein|nr:MupA/Atu3671 family FMN-dependent luciferase-like monooxygenase [Actinospica sp.]